MFVEGLTFPLPDVLQHQDEENAPRCGQEGERTKGKGTRGVFCCQCRVNAGAPYPDYSSFTFRLDHSFNVSVTGLKVLLTNVFYYHTWMMV